MKLRRVERTVTCVETSDGAGVSLCRSIGTQSLDHLDPFLLFDEFKSDQAGDYIAGFPDHPHRGFETVTYMLAGRMEHRDHKGNRGNLVAGSIQWMTAGRGIIHSEMPQQEKGLMWGFQLWINLPSALKMSEPRYQDIPPEDVPELALDHARIRVLSGQVNGIRGPIDGVVTDPIYLDIRLDPDSSFRYPVPAGHTAFVYVFEGAGRVGISPEEPDGVAAEPGHLLALGDGDAVEMAANDRSLSLLLLAAKPIGEPIARYGPFVMNTQDELRKAFRELGDGTFLDGSPQNR